MTTNLKKLGITAMAATLISAFAVTANAQTAGIITKDQAVEKIFATSKGLLLEIELDDHKRTPAYDIDILDGNSVREYKVDALNGNIIRYKTDYINPQHAAALNSVKVNYKDAEKAALAKYPKGKVFDLSLKAEGPQPIYKVHVTDNDAMHYTVIVDAMNGNVLSAAACEYIPTKPTLDRATAEGRALAAFPNSTVIKTQLDEDDGWLIYEVYLLSNGNMYNKVKVNANTGEVFSKKMKRDNKRNW